MSALETTLVKVYQDWCLAHGTTSIPAEAWKEILTAGQYKAAVDSGFWGAPGQVSGIDYTDAKWTGVQGASNPVAPEGFTYRLFVDGVVTATEDGPASFDTVAFAKRHGVDI